LQDLLVAHDVAFGAFQVGPKGAERAAVNADVGGVQVRVDVVVGEVAVLPLAHPVGQLAEREQVGLFLQEQAVLEGKALASLDLRGDGVQRRHLMCGHGLLVICRRLPWRPSVEPRKSPTDNNAPAAARQDTARSSIVSAWPSTLTTVLY